MCHLEAGGIIANNMARPTKEPAQRRSTHLRVPVTEAERAIIMEAIANEPDGFAAWARSLMLQAAREKVKGTPSKRQRKADAESNME